MRASESHGKKIKVLVIDDEKVVREFLLRFLALEGIEAIEAESGQEALEEIKKEPFGLVFMELTLPDCDGLKFLREIKRLNPHCRYVIMTGGIVAGEELEQASKEGAYVCLKKPFEIEEIRQQVKEARFASEESG